MQVRAINFDMKNSPKQRNPFGASFVRAAASIAKTGVRPNDGIVELVKNTKFQKRLFSEFLRNRLSFVPVLNKKADVIAQKGANFVENARRYTDKAINGTRRSVENFTRSFGPRNSFETFRNDILTWFDNVSHKAIIKVRIEQSEVIEKSLKSSRESFEKLKRAATLSEVETLQRGLRRNFSNSQFAYSLKSSDYIKHKTAKNAHFLSIAKAQLDEMRKIIVQTQRTARAKKVEIIKGQEEKLRYHLVVFMGRTHDSKRVRKISNRDLKAMSTSGNTALRSLANDLLGMRVAENMNDNFFIKR